MSDRHLGMRPLAAPVVGITTSEQQARWGCWDTTATLVPADYVRRVEAAGAVAVLLPAPAAAAGDERAAAAAAATAVARLDGIVLTGGVDVDPARYGESSHEQTQSPDPARDVYELALVAECARSSKPLLAICRGMQLLNVARGGTLLQHLPDEAGRRDHMPDPGSFVPRSVRVVPGSRLAEVAKSTELVVPCHHHQAVGRVGEGLVVSAVCDDGVVEALEGPGPGFLLGVQWHPEAERDASLFDALVRACS